MEEGPWSRAFANDGVVGKPVCTVPVSVLAAGDTGVKGGDEGEG